MRIDGIPGPELKQQGFTIYEVGNLVKLRYKGKVVVTLYAATITPDLIKAAAWSWLKEQGEQAD